MSVSPAFFSIGGVIFKDRKARDTGVMAWEALLHTGLLAQVVKHLAGRQRPRVESGIDYWYGPVAFFKRYSQGSFSRYDSFFSGHTVSAWSLATVIAENYKERLMGADLLLRPGHPGWLSRLIEDGPLAVRRVRGRGGGLRRRQDGVRNQDKRMQVSPALARQRHRPGRQLRAQLSRRFSRG